MKKSSMVDLKLAVFFVILLSSCNNPLKRNYDPATYEEDIQAIRQSNKVSDEDLKTLSQYLLLAKLSGNDVTGKTYSDILDRIESLRQNNTDLDSRNELEIEAKRNRLSPFLEVSLQNKIFTKQKSRDVLVYTVTFKNTGTQKIKTVTGNLLINDLIGKPIKKLAIFLDEDILPRQILTKTYAVEYNNADENDRRMRSKDFPGIRIVWNPEKIIFENGRLAE